MLPPDPPDTLLDHVLGVLLTCSLWAWALFALLALLKRSRPGMAVGLPVAVGYVVRLLAIAAVTATGLGSVLRGGDEITFLDAAHLIAASPFGSSDWLPFGTYGLHEILFALQLRFGGLTADAMRCTDVGLAMLGTTLIVVSVFDLGGQRAARLTAWLLALEPASIFFSEVLHKDPLMIFASGLVVFGATRTWRQLSLGGLAIMGAGVLVGVATRPYAGWFLLAAAVLLTAHASLRGLTYSRGRATTLLIAVGAALVVALPAALAATSSSQLAILQGSQNTNTSAAGTAGNSLALESVNFSTRSAIVTNLPKRMFDLLLKPLPWQLGDSSQQVGVLGTLVAYAVLAMFALYAVRLGRQVMTVAAPLLYPLFCLLIAYSLSVGNAGTGFRYRTHIITLAIAAVVLMRERWLVQVGARAPAGAQHEAVRSGAVQPIPTRRGPVARAGW